MLIDLARHGINTFMTLAVQALKGIITAYVKNLVASLITNFIVASMAVLLWKSMASPKDPRNPYVPPPDGEYKIQI